MRGAARSNFCTLAVNPYGRARGEDRNIVVALHGLQHVENFEAFALQKLFPVQHLGTPDVGRFENGEPMVGGLGFEPGSDNAF